MGVVANLPIALAPGKNFDLVMFLMICTLQSVC